MELIYRLIIEMPWNSTLCVGRQHVHQPFDISINKDPMQSFSYSKAQFFLKNLIMRRRACVTFFRRLKLASDKPYHEMLWPFLGTALGITAVFRGSETSHRTRGSILINGFRVMMRWLVVTSPADGSSSKAIFSFSSRRGHVIIVRFLQVEIDLFHNEFPLFILLACFVSFGICPTYHILASLAVDITNTMETSDQEPVLRWTDADIDTVIKKISSS